MKKTSFILFFIVAGYNSYAQLTYPDSPSNKVYNDYQGVSVEDDYQWLENLNSNKTKVWVENQKQLLNDYLDHDSNIDVKKRMQELFNLDLYSAPIKRNGFYYYSKTDAKDSKRRIYVQKKIESKEKVFLDPKFKDGEYSLRASGASSGIGLSQNGNWLTFNISKSQQRWFEVWVHDVKNNSPREKIKGLHSTGGGPLWLGDKGFFYNKFNPPEDGSTLTSKLGNPNVYFHKVGTIQSDDDIILGENFLGDGWLYFLGLTNNNKYLIVNARKGSSSKNRIYYYDIENKGSLKPLLIEENANYLYLGNKGNTLYFYTDLNAPRGRVVSVSLNNKEIKEIIPPSEEVISAGSLAGGDAIGYFNEKFVIKYTVNGGALIKVFNNDGKFLFSPDLPLGGSVWGNFTGEPFSNEVFYQFLGLIDPSSIYKLDLETGKVKVFKRSLQYIDEDAFLVEKVSVEGKDKVQIPMFIARKKGTPVNGKSPGFIYGYGALGWTSFIWYQPHIIHWLEIGGVYAIPGIRGGGELGKEWHEAGKKLNKQNSIDDYIAASEWLIQNNYVHKDKLIANGGSLSAAVAAAALNQRPNLYGAAVIDRPALDLLRFPKFTGAKSWIQEIGSPDNKEEFDVLYSYSPYHNIGNKCYPPTLVMVGDKDDTTPPLHAYKYIAKLQTESKCKSNPILLKVMPNTGHNFGATNEQKADSLTDLILFLKKTLQM
ncbi:MAG: prolyl oligopeptidase family serine peptidase [Saonia sp.]